MFQFVSEAVETEKNLMEIQKEILTEKLSPEIIFQWDGFQNLYFKLSDSATRKFLIYESLTDLNLFIANSFWSN